MRKIGNRLLDNTKQLKDYYQNHDKYHEPSVQSWKYKIHIHKNSSCKNKLHQATVLGNPTVGTVVQSIYKI